jgi:hypothetical protein
MRRTAVDRKGRIVAGLIALSLAASRPAAAERRVALPTKVR